MKVQVCLNDELIRLVDSYAGYNSISRSAVISLALVHFISSSEYKSNIAIKEFREILSR